MAASSTPAAPALRCTLQAPAQVVAGQPVVLRFTLTNPGPVALQMLRWNTPFEGAWLAPFVTVERAGRPLAYQGPMVKRAEPKADQYLRIEPGASVSAEVDLAQPFDLSALGLYHVRPRLALVDLFDARKGEPPRLRQAHVGAAQACNAVDVRITPPPSSP
jgi:peptidyl-Lys metalloendopeptidase